MNKIYKLYKIASGKLVVYKNCTLNPEKHIIYIICPRDKEVLYKNYIWFGIDMSEKTDMFALTGNYALFVDKEITPEILSKKPVMRYKNNKFIIKLLQKDSLTDREIQSMVDVQETKKAYETFKIPCMFK